MKNVTTTAPHSLPGNQPRALPLVGARFIVPSASHPHAPHRAHGRRNFSSVIPKRSEGLAFAYRFSHSSTLKPLLRIHPTCPIVFLPRSNSRVGARFIVPSALSHRRTPVGARTTQWAGPYPTRYSGTIPSIILIRSTALLPSLAQPASRQLATRSVTRAARFPALIPRTLTTPLLVTLLRSKTAPILLPHTSTTAACSLVGYT
jgi:hypothetical protein